MDIKIFLIRISVCFILSILIGLERQYRHKTVGLRTNVLVCLGSFLFVYISLNSLTSDTTRIAAQVVSGIGFLGAGIILKDGNKVKGLNTAATLWCVAAIGIMTSFGLLIEASIGTFFVLISNLVLRIISQFIMNRIKTKQKNKYILNITYESKLDSVIRTTIAKLLDKYNFTLEKLEQHKINDEEIKYEMIINTTYNNTIDEMINSFSKQSGIIQISWENIDIITSDNNDIDE